MGSIMLKLLVVILLLANIVLGYGGWKQQQIIEVLVVQLHKQQIQLVEQQEQLESLKSEVAELNGNSIDGMVRDANESILGAFQGMLETLGNDLDEAKKSLEEEFKQQDPSSKQAPAAPEATNSTSSEPAVESSEKQEAI